MIQNIVSKLKHDLNVLSPLFLMKSRFTRIFW